MSEWRAVPAPRLFQKVEQALYPRKRTLAGVYHTTDVPTIRVMRH